MEFTTLSNVAALLPWAGLALAVVPLVWFAVRRFTPRRLERMVSTEVGYSTVVDALSDGVLIYGEDGCIKACNPAAGAMLGRHPHDLIGARSFGTDWKVKDEAGHEVTEDNHPIHQVLHAGRSHVRAILKVESPDGRSRWIRSSVKGLAPSPQFGTGAAMAKLRDVTDQLREEQALKEAERTFRNLFERSPNAASITRAADGLVIEVNEAWCQLFGWTREEALGRTVFDLGIWFRPEDRTTLLESLDQAQVLNAWPFATARKDGSGLHTSLGLASLQLNGEGCLMAVLQDHTQVRASEQAQHKVEKAESLGLMAAGLSHDFNNLFQSLMTSLELAHSQSDSSGRPFLDRAMTSLDRASNLSRRLMEFSGGSFTHLGRVSINALLRDLADSHSKQGQPPIQSSLAPELPEILADRDQIVRVLSILLENAAEAMGSSTGTVTVASELVSVVSPAERRSGLWMMEAPDGPLVRVSVSDTAGGVSRDTLDHLFDPFYSTKALGRGLGLSAALGLIRGHQGGLQVINVSGEGMTFHIYLPVERRA